MKHAIIYNFFKNYKEGDIIKINPAEIKKIPELQNVFRIDLDVKDRIKDDMAVNGFSKAHPVHVFKWVIAGQSFYLMRGLPYRLLHHHPLLLLCSSLLLLMNVPLCPDQVM